MYARGRQHDALGRNDDRPVELGNFLDPFAHPRVVQVALFAAVAADRIETGRMAAGQHLARIADDEQRAHRLALAPFAADRHGDIDHRLERVQRNAGFQLPQIARGELTQVLAQVDDADRILGFGLEAAVDGHHPGAGARMSSATLSNRAWVSFS